MSAIDEIPYDSLDDIPDARMQFITFSEIVYQTSKGILLQTVKGKCWLPRNHIDLEGCAAHVPGWISIEYFEG